VTSRVEKVNLVLRTIEEGCVMTLNDSQPKTISVPAAGRLYFDLAKNASYEAARRGDIPVIRIGGRLRVPVVALERMLEQAGLGQATVPNLIGQVRPLRAKATP
jgi:hypothetical protein